MYQMRFDTGSSILHLQLTGFWTDETMTRFAGELLPLVQRLTRTEAGLAILSDCRHYPVQSPEIVAGWSRILAADGPIKAPYAIVVGTVLNKLQAGRALTAPNVAIFTELDAATEWLDARREGAPAR
jgi:hypothetical protein